MGNPNFVKGMKRPPNAGRKKGSKNIRKVARVADVLAERGINPAEEILAILDSGTLDDKDKIKSWADLQSYCEAKPKAVEPEKEGGLNPGDYVDVSDDDLLKLVRKEGS